MVKWLATDSRSLQFLFMPSTMIAVIAGTMVLELQHPSAHVQQ